MIIVIIIVIPTIICFFLINFVRGQGFEGLKVEAVPHLLLWLLVVVLLWTNPTGCPLKPSEKSPEYDPLKPKKFLNMILLKPKNILNMILLNPMKEIKQQPSKGCPKSRRWAPSSRLIFSASI